MRRLNNAILLLALAAALLCNAAFGQVVDPLRPLRPVIPTLDGYILRGALPSISSQAGNSLLFSSGGAGTTLSVGDPGYGLGSVAVFQMNTGGNSLDGLTGNAFVVPNRVVANFYTSPGNTYALSGSSMVSPININTNFSGSTTNVLPAAYKLTIASDTVDALNAANAFTLLDLQQNVMPGAKGGRATQLVQLNLTSGNLAAGGSQQYAASNFWAFATANVGGTDTGAGSHGSLYGTNPQIVLGSGATNWGLVNPGGEIDLALQTGSSVRLAQMQSQVLLATHAVAPALYHAGLLIGAQVGAMPTISNPFVIGGPDGPWPVAATGSGAILGTLLQNSCGGNNRTCLMNPQRSPGGTDYNAVVFSASAFRSAGFAVDPTGQVTVGGGLLTSTNATGYQIAAPNTAKVTSIAVATPGIAATAMNNYYPGDIVYDASTPANGQYQITNTKVISASIVGGGSGGTNGTQTVTGTTGSGFGFFQASVTVSGGAITSVLSITTPGNYTLNPNGVGKDQTSGATLAEPVTGAGLVGATLNLGMGALTVGVLSGGVFASCPGAGGIAPIGGSGSGLTLSPTCGIRDGITLANSTGKVGFFGATPTAKLSPSGACAGNTGCQALRDALGTLGLINTGGITN